MCLHLLVPTTDLLGAATTTALRCGVGGIAPFAKSPPLPDPGVLVSVAFTLGIERYRYPRTCRRSRAKSGSALRMRSTARCCRPTSSPPFVVADVGANPGQYGNQGILLNSDGLKQWLFGPLDGPPRNTAQIGTAGMTAIDAARSSSSASSRVVMVLLTAFLFVIFGQYRTGSTDGYSAVFTDASRLESGDTVRVAGIRVGTVDGRAVAGRTQGPGRLRRRPATSC